MNVITHASISAGVMLLLANAVAAAEPAPPQPPRKPVKLPGLVIDFQNRCVDVEAVVCLEEGFLELIACTKGSKEHESILAVSARPMHIHTALLLLGATNGHPALRKPLNKEATRWADVPPRGDAVEVFLAFKDPRGKLIERPIADFVSWRGDHDDATTASQPPASTSPSTAGERKAEAGGKVAKERDVTFPKAFLFAGSQLRDEQEGARGYLADVSGHVASIVTFGDELLCLPGIQSQASGALDWQVNSRHLPKVGTKVTLRLRPRKRPKAAGTD